MFISLNHAGISWLLLKLLIKGDSLLPWNNIFTLTSLDYSDVIWLMITAPAGVERQSLKYFLLHWSSVDSEPELMSESSCCHRRHSSDTGGPPLELGIRANNNKTNRSGPRCEILLANKYSDNNNVALYYYIIGTQDSSIVLWSSIPRVSTNITYLGTATVAVN